MKLTEKMVPYKIVHSKRKTMAIQVKKDGNVEVRCPLGVPDKEIHTFVWEHRDWIATHQQEVLKRLEEKAVYTEEQIKEYRQHARWLMAQKTWIWAEKMQITYGKITIRQQATRWGSCSGKGNLNFNWKLVLLPEELIDYVVVHELAHRKEMNHSPRFWEIVKQQIPDYKERRKRLREYEAKV